MISLTEAQLKAFRDTFKLTSTDNTTDVGSADIKRKMLAVYIKKGDDTNGDFELLGYKQESASIASNYDTSEISDVNGVHYLDNLSKAEKLEMSEYHLNPKATKFLEEAVKLKIFDREDLMNDYEILIVHGYLRDESGKCLATKETGCTLTLDNAGGKGVVTNDVSIALSGIKTFGTVPEIVAKPTFTEYTPAASQKAVTK